MFRQVGIHSGSARQGRRRGAAMLEGALILVPLLVLIVCLMDVALALFVKASFEHAVREGARYAITYSRFDGMGQDASIRQVVVKTSYGFLKPENVKVCYLDPNSNKPDECIKAPGGNLPDNIVVVEVAGFSWTWAFGSMNFFNDKNGDAPFPITARSADRMEALPAGQSAPVR